MTHIHWVARQNKLETPKEKDEVNKREVHECDGWARDAMVAPPTPKPTHKVEDLVRESPTIVSRCEENTVLWKSYWSRLCCANWSPETKARVSSPPVKAPVLRTNPNIDEATTTPKPHTHPSHPQTPHPSTPSSSLGSTSPSKATENINFVKRKHRNITPMSPWSPRIRCVKCSTDILV
jgi:hypothetical protein